MKKQKRIKSMWIENHPFWMAVIISIFISIYSIAFYISNSNSKDLQSVLIWLPFIWFLVFIVPVLNWGCEKLQK